MCIESAEPEEPASLEKPSRLPCPIKEIKSEILSGSFAMPFRFRHCQGFRQSHNLPKSLTCTTTMRVKATTLVSQVKNSHVTFLGGRHSSKNPGSEARVFRCSTFW